jgi:predicted AAA+ superfamily ATPase
MKRMIFSALRSWKEQATRKPLLIRGARQVGKTWVVRELGKLFKEFIEINFELYPEAKKIFHRDLDPTRLIRDLSLLAGKSIVPGEALIFFDEVQEEPKAIQALRYFYELLPAQHVIAAGSLLDFKLEKIGMPVGRVSSIYMYPMSFLEFLAAQNEALLIEMIVEHKEATTVSEPVHLKLLRLLGEYFAIGGMPEAVACWREFGALEKCASIHRAIVDTYRQDFNKYVQKFQIKYVDLLFNLIPARLGKKFKFSEVPGEYRKRDLQPALDLLVKAGVVQKIIHSSGAGIPLGAQAKPDTFKLIFLDLALAQSILGLDAASWLLESEVNFVNKGEITEAFCGQEILAYSSFDLKPQLYFWQRQERSSSAEVDYLLQRHQQILPVEVKSGAPGTLKSLRLFLDAHKRLRYGIRLSALNYAAADRLLSMPLYAIARVMNLTKEQVGALF